MEWPSDEWTQYVSFECDSEGPALLTGPHSLSLCWSHCLGEWPSSLLTENH